MELFNVEKILHVSTITTISTLLVVFLGILYLVFKCKRRLHGPPGLPFFGCWPFLREETVHLTLQENMKKYGDGYSFKCFGQFYIHLGSIQSVKEAHITKVDSFGQRSTDYGVLTALFNEGVICVSGSAWKTIRKFFVQAFREFGLTSLKDYLAGPVYDSVAAAIEDLRANGDKPVNIARILSVRSPVILRRMLFNDDGITEKELNDIMEAYEKTFSMFSQKRLLMNGEFARRFIFPLYSDHKTVTKNLKIVSDTLRKIIKRHEEQFEEDNIRDMIDSYIKERNDRRKKNDPTFQYFTENGLIDSLIQIVGDGTLSVAGFIGFFIQTLLEHPEEQEKIFKELEEVVGHDRQPTLNDKSKTSYTNAFLLETQRMITFFNILPGLQCTKETTINGHRVPKGAITLMNFWSCHRDPKVYENPHEFRPSRFLTEPGKPKEETPIFFGVGKRSCAGESFVMMQVYVFLTTIVKNFRLTKAEGYTTTSFAEGKLEIYAHPRK